MTKFQKWIIALLIVSGFFFLYFWRSDVQYKRERDEERRATSDGKFKFINPF